MQKRGFWFRFIVYGLPLLLWMSFIFLMSTPTGSSRNTRPIVRSILRRLFPDVNRYLTPQQIDSYDWAIRKGAHVTEYMILALLTYRALRQERRDFHHRYPALTLVIGLLYAVSDEFHQTMVPGRDGAIKDVLIDLMGVSLGTGLSLWWHCGVLAKSTAADSASPTV